eukprot:TRINITY_DN442_c0_g2_i1.p1 TRINITY_DN442_c0_g2~~TRINITY_DN442_c0_g2_i1.p1  ORF type:complete len:891 (+),score=137.38 TRINITY_DN442_c0_g2_i1:120-2792(+)
MQFDLSGVWQFETLGSKKGDNVKCECTVPGLVHEILVSTPYDHEEELKQRWISKEDWTFSKKFKITKETIDNYASCDLSVEGIDTIATIKINNVVVGKTMNQFCYYSFPVKSSLVDGDNEISVEIESPILYCESQADKQPYHIPCMLYMNGENHWNQIRKRACSFGWDWGPCFPTIGIHKPIKLEFYNKRLHTFNVRQTNIEAKEATIQLSIIAESGKREEDSLPAKITVKINDCTIEKQLNLLRDTRSSQSTSDLFIATMKIENPKLWYPTGYGEQNLYEVSLAVDGFENTKLKKIVGLRRVELVCTEDEDKKGESFYFRINGISVYSKGANWIPLHCFSTKVTNDQVRKMIDNVKKANMNTIRIWGGGDYESDFFYEYCDIQGILVWQDLMFACSLYPADKEFLENVSREITQQVRRLSSHPSILVICGNNENEEALYNKWLKSDDSKSRGMEPLIVDYHKLFIDTIYPIVQKELHVENVEPYDASNNKERLTIQNKNLLIPYWSSSPSNGMNQWMNPALQERGDIHYWGVWHGSKGFQEYLKINPRFCSEFGFQSFPSSDTLSEVLKNPDDWNVSSPAMEFRQRSPAKGNMQIVEHVIQHFRFPSNFENFITISQILQAVSIRTAIEHWRRIKPYCMGAIYWQLNDIWQGPSWSSIEHSGRWKVLHYFVKQSFSPLMVSFEYDDQQQVNQQSLDKCDMKKPIKLWITSDIKDKVKVRTEIILYTLSMQALKTWDIESVVNEYASEKVSWEVTPEEIISILPSGMKLKDVFLVVNTIHDEFPQRNFLFFVRYKSLSLPKARLNYEVVWDPDMSKAKINVSTDALALFVTIHHDQLGILSDNGFMLLPHESRTIIFELDETARSNVISKSNTLDDKHHSAFKVLSLCDL